MHNTCPPPAIAMPIDTKTHDGLYADQLDLEIRSVDKGIERYREIRAEGKQILSPEQAIIQEYLPLVSLRIAEFQGQFVTGTCKEGDNLQGINKWGLPLSTLEADKLALIALFTTMSMTSTTDHTTTKIAMAIACAVKTERYFALIKENAPDVVKVLMSRTKRVDKRTVYKAKRRAKLADLDWDKQTRGHVGMKLLEAVIEATDLFDYEMEWQYGQSTGVVHMNYATLTRLEAQHSEMEVLRPVQLPMVIPPIDWDEEEKGGYVYLKYPMVKSFGEKVKQDSEIVYAGLNMLQRTAWRINKRLFKILSYLWENQSTIGNLPRREYKELPPKPLTFNPNAKKKHRWDGVPEDEKKAWFEKAASTWTLNTTSKSLRKAMLFKLNIGRMYQGYERIYFPHQLDWRGRVYPVVSHVSPQADDSGRALLEFADGTPLGDGGMYDLCVHAANLMGYDKGLSLDSRVRRVLALSTNELPKWASDPYHNQGWATINKGDDAFKLLAAVLEIADAMKLDGRSLTFENIRGYAPTFLTRLPCARDGACNGLQHLSAIGLDSVGGRATNLVPGDIPRDIYEDVTKVVTGMIEVACTTLLAESAGALPEENPCLAWRGRITRSTCKRGVMTTPYGITPQGMRIQFISGGHCDDLPGLAGKNANYLKGVMYDAVGEVVVAARVIMDYLRAVAKEAAKTNRPMVWTTPCGFKASQRYYHSDRVTIFTTLQRISLRETNPNSAIDAEAQVRGTTPNFIHGVDAAHLFLVLWSIRKWCEETGTPLIPFAAVHDDYGPPAPYVSMMNRVIREEFIKMHTPNLLEVFKQEIETNLGIVLDPVPPRGDLHLPDVMQSTYIFH